MIVVNTIEPTRVLDVLAALADELRQMAFYEFSRTDGVVEAISRAPVSDDTTFAGAIDAAQSMFKSRPNSNFVFVDVEDIDSESSTSRHFAELARLAEARQGSIILIVDKPVWSGLSRLGMSITLELPTAEEMNAIIAGLIDDHRGVVSVEWQPDDVRRVSETLVGITASEAVNILATLLTKGHLGLEEIDEVSQLKDAVFSELNGLEKVHLTDDYSVGGLRNLRTWLDEREFAMKADLSRSPLRPPKGVLLVGVPGCGKSLSAKAVAAQWHMPLYRFDMAGILGMYVGQSESRMKEALSTADRVAPCVLWIDEIEKALANGGGDSGTTKRLIGQFLFWLQESEKKVFVVATANDVTSLPPELLRKGRFDELFFVDLPDADDRAEIIRLYFGKYLGVSIPDADVTALVDASEGFAGSDIDAVIHDIAWAVARGRLGDVRDIATVLEYFHNVVPYSQTNPEDVRDIRQWGRTRAVPAGTASHSESQDNRDDRRRVMIL